MDDWQRGIQARIHEEEPDQQGAMTSEEAADILAGAIIEHAKPGDRVQMLLDPKKLGLGVIVDGNEIMIIHFFKRGNFIPHVVERLVNERLSEYCRALPDSDGDS